MKAYPSRNIWELVAVIVLGTVGLILVARGFMGGDTPMIATGAFIVVALKLADIEDQIHSLRKEVADE